MQNNHDLQYMKNHKELLDELHKAKEEELYAQKELMNLQVKFEESFAKQLIEINHEKEEAILIALQALAYYETSADSGVAKDAIRRIKEKA